MSIEIDWLTLDVRVLFHSLLVSSFTIVWKVALDKHTKTTQANSLGKLSITTKVEADNAAELIVNTESELRFKHRSKAHIRARLPTFSCRFRLCPCQWNLLHTLKPIEKRIVDALALTHHRVTFSMCAARVQHGDSAHIETAERAKQTKRMRERNNRHNVLCSVYARLVLYERCNDSDTAPNRIQQNDKQINFCNVKIQQKVK